MEEIKLKIEELNNELIKHTYLYEEEKPIITDSEYDLMFKELVELEDEYPEYILEDSITQKVYTKLETNLKKYVHSQPMISQSNIFDEKGIIKFLETLKNEGETSVLIQHKLDGLTVVLTYENNVLERAVTRGDGNIGEIVTHTVRTCKNVPDSLKNGDNLEVRGEALILKEDFESYNKDGKYSNTRNLASGTVRKLNAKEIEDRNLKFIAFDLVSAKNEFETDTEKLAYLKDVGLEVTNTVEFPLIGDVKFEDIVDYVLTFANEKRDDIPYVIDGLVLKAKTLKVRENLGSTNKHPRWSTAFKFPSNNAITTLLDIELSMGKTGQVTPVAIFETISIDNVNINRASLSNFNILEKRDIRIGDKILVERAKDVIPMVVKSFPELREEDLKEYERPTNCPVCEEKLSEKYAGILFCMNENCESNIVKKVIHFASKKSLDIVGLSKQTITRLFEEGFLTDIPSIYELKDRKEEIIALKGFETKSVENLLENIELSKETTQEKFLTGLSIDKIGLSASKDITKVISLKVILKLIKEDKEKLSSLLLSIDGFGEGMLDSFIKYFDRESNILLVNTLLAFGVNPKIVVKDNKDVVVNTNIVNKNFVITGKLSKPRSEIEKDIEENGGVIQKSVNTKTDYLILNDSNSKSSKSVKAKELGVSIISEEHLYENLMSN